MHSVEELYERMMGDFAARTGIAAADSCDLAARMYALAAQIHALEAESDWVRRQCFPQTAQGENLDHHAQMRALERKKGARAKGVVRFSVGTAGDTVRTVPVGTVCMTAGLVRFETTGQGIIAPGEMWVDVPVQAVEIGAAGNAAPGTITVMSVAPVGVASCTNPAPCSGGVDEEDDESLRRRVLDSFRSLPNGANAAYYRALALSDEDTAEAVVVSRPRGVGSVDVVVSAYGGLPGEDLLKRLQEKMDAEREIAVDLRVLAPETLPVSLAVEVLPAQGHDPAAVLGGVEEALRNLFDGRLLGKGVLLAKLGSIIYGCEGVENYRITAPAADVAVEEIRLPVLENLSVEVMV